MKKNKALDEFEQEIEDGINQRRRQMLVHSFIYYRLGTSIIEDRKFDKWAYHLVSLQNTYPDISARCIYPDEFKIFDGTTGFDLPLYERWIETRAKQLIDYHKKKEKELGEKWQEVEQGKD